MLVLVTLAPGDVMNIGSVYLESHGEVMNIGCGYLQCCGSGSGSGSGSGRIRNFLQDLDPDPE